MIKKDDVKKIASLSKLKYSDEELNDFSNQFQKIISFFDTLDQVDTQGVKPTYQSSDLENIFRTDVAKNSGQRDELLKNAPTAKNGLIQVPSIIEE
ncbi:Asp-tRNA(Asn)/Glu-tRNA(Gln) amidotransferase subunit GatC [Xylocopilactobacillus apicola]|uniref:Aspartyl/glutamyl-tRNA(Asn/Gln) amidotransferase subunit C n=1 Tax=Xylocopilactobacillus apicola TaxID=2932184 RepID=A0AAU9DCD1_9LACO|nr:Asp-tRNA(Asn)/Glu-tRNA(Gln) amidotransferase subunit GatC [Xylocopilactobacillus apicola]BDR58457.1 aspartyl/glutamyl-tRNA(Asn/Gln) amidotransferase subunit C [Xylocopilactobacillus apicola]